MKKLILLVVLLCPLLTFFSCQDPCKNTNCLNGGFCSDGSCVCPEGWVGEDCSLRSVNLRIVSGDAQLAVAGQNLPKSITIGVTDDNNQPLENIPVHFNLPTNDGRLSAATVLTDAYGLASAEWTIGALVGTQTVEVIGGDKAVTFQAEVLKPTFTDPRDGQEYKIMVVGDEIWMAENLRYPTPNSYINPDYPNFGYGLLYNWNEALVACPNGWHLASDYEWTKLEIAAGMDPGLSSEFHTRGNHAAALRSAIDWASGSNGTGTFGFNAFPAGYKMPDGSVALGDNTCFWTSTKLHPIFGPISRDIVEGVDGVVRQYMGPEYMFSCRCVQD